VHRAATVQRSNASHPPGKRLGRQSQLQRAGWKFQRPAWLPGAEILVAPCSPLPTHLYTERYAVWLCRRAPAGQHECRDQSFGREPCAGRLIHPGDVYVNERPCQCTGFRILFLEPSIIVAASREIGVARTPRFQSALSKDTALVGAVTGLCAAVEQCAEAAEQQSRLAACLRCMLELMADSHSSNPRDHHAVTRARDYLQQRFHEAVTLEELAGVARLSRYHLLRSFSAQVGLPPHAYQLRLRIERAMALLRSGLPASTVAGLAGFADQSHLTRHFRRLVRVTPAEYARAAETG
jgi:AraC-like DNA-binding protein